MSVRPALSKTAAALYDEIRDIEIVSPHGHCDPSWFSENAPFSDPATLLVTPDHYVFRMLYSQGVALEDLGIGVRQEDSDPREVFRLFASHWHLFLGTPSRAWIEYTLAQTLGIQDDLSEETADKVYDQITEKLSQDAFRPRAAMDALKIEVLATTDGALDNLEAHQKLRASSWQGNVIPTFRPDDILNPLRAGHAKNIARLGEITGENTTTYAGFLAAIETRRAQFRKLGATATDHDVPNLGTVWLSRAQIEALHHKAVQGTLTTHEAQEYYGHMLVEMAQMSADDGMVMQIHAGSMRSTNQDVLQRFGADKGADIPVAIDWVRGLDALLNRVGNHPNFRLLAFTLDESTYARELAPMAGHWPCLRLGPPWWFHDSANGIRRYFDSVVETAGYWNLAGFNDDTRAFLSIPARHDLWRRGVSLHLSDQVESGVFGMADARRLAPLLARDLAVDAYRLEI